MEEGIDRTYLEHLLPHHTTKEEGHGVKHTASAQACSSEGGREGGREGWRKG